MPRPPDYLPERRALTPIFSQQCNPSPVPDEASVVDFMALCARAAGCSHAPFRQAATPGLDSSCYGISLFWLSKRKHKGDPWHWGDIRFATSHFAMNVDKIRAIHLQQSFGEVLSENLMRELDLSYHEKYKELNMDPEQIAEFFCWLFNTTPRYFLLESRHHYMALVVPRHGICQFLDPNGGIVQAPNAAAMRTFLVAYLSNSKLRKHYGSKDRLNLIRVTAHKLK